MAAKSLPHVSYLNECFDLNKETYELFWKERPLSHFKGKRDQRAWNTRYAGKKAGRLTEQGYLLVRLDTHTHQNHRVIHKLLTCEDYDGHFDHKDNCRTNNHPDNLRKATNGQNMTNTTRAAGKYKYRGVAQVKGRSKSFYSQLSVGKTPVYVGSWSTHEEAHSARCLAALHFHKEFAHFGEGSCYPDFPLTSEFVSKVRHFINKAEEKMRRVNEA
jgi:hypothetical protein